MKTLMVWGICQIKAPTSEVQLDQLRKSVDTLFLLERKNSWLMVSLQISGLETTAFFSKISIPDPKILISNFLLDTSFHHSFQSVIITS